MGISGDPSRSKSMLGTNEFLPRDSRTEELRISKISISFSNLTSVFEGWILTSIESGFVSRKRKYEGINPSGIRFVYAFKTDLCR